MNEETTMRKLILILILALAPAVGLGAEPIAGKVVLDARQGAITAINNLGLDAARTSSAIDVEDWGAAKVQVRYTYDSATVVTIKFEESDDGTTWSKITKTDSADETTELAPYWTTGDASANFTIVLDVVAYTNIRVIISSTGGTSSDLATVIVRNARGI